MSRTPSFYDLRDALAEPGCPICQLMDRTAERYLDSLLWENVNDVKVRDEIRQARGLCRDHSWDLARHRAALGTAIITRDVLQSVLEELEESGLHGPLARPLRSAQAFLRARLSPKAECPACVQVREMEDIFLRTFVAHLLGPEGLMTAYEVSEGLCLSHFRRALDRVRQQKVLTALVRTQSDIWKRLVGELTEFIRKNDYRFRDEPWGDERDAWRRAIAALAGAPRAYRGSSGASS
jgi:hypothetical protein